MVKKRTLDDVIKDKSNNPEFTENYNRELLINYLSKTLRDLRKNNNLSQKDLAIRMGTTQPVIARLESGYDSRMPSLDLLIRFASACGSSLHINFGDYRKLY